jgi:hypothetical protein
MGIDDGGISDDVGLDQVVLDFPRFYSMTADLDLGVTAPYIHERPVGVLSDKIARTIKTTFGSKSILGCPSWICDKRSGSLVLIVQIAPRQKRAFDEELAGCPKRGQPVEVVWVSYPECAS